MEYKNVILFLAISLNMCFGCSKELSHRSGSFEYPQHIFRLENKKIYFQFYMHSYLEAWVNLINNYFIIIKHAYPVLETVQIQKAADRIHIVFHSAFTFAC